MDRPGGVLLTVVTVVRNDPAGLAASLASLAAQDTPPGQVVVLDGSDDREAVRPSSPRSRDCPWSTRGSGRRASTPP